MPHVLLGVMEEMEAEQIAEREARLRSAHEARRAGASHYGRTVGAENLARYREANGIAGKPRRAASEKRRTPPIQSGEKRMPAPRENQEKAKLYFMPTSARLTFLMRLAVLTLSKDRNVTTVPTPKERAKERKTAAANELRLVRRDGSLIVSKVVATALEYFEHHLDVETPGFESRYRCWWLEYQAAGYDSHDTQATSVSLYSDSAARIQAIADRLKGMPNGSPPQQQILVMAICAAAYATGQTTPLCDSTP